MRWSHAIFRSLGCAQLGWFAANCLALTLICLGYGQSFCGVGYTPTWIDSAANYFLFAVSRPLTIVPDWLYAPNSRLVDTLELLAPHFADRLVVASMLAANYEMAAVPLAASRYLIRHAVRSGLSALLPSER